MGWSSVLPACRQETQEKNDGGQYRLQKTANRSFPGQFERSTIGVERSHHTHSTRRGYFAHIRDESARTDHKRFASRYAIQLRGCLRKDFSQWLRASLARCHVRRRGTVY